MNDKLDGGIVAEQLSKYRSFKDVDAIIRNAREQPGETFNILLESTDEEAKVAHLTALECGSLRLSFETLRD